MYTATDLSTQQLADQLNVTPRMINIYRVQAEASEGKRLGKKRGKTTFFTPEEQDLIRKTKTAGLNVEESKENHQHRAAPDFHTANNQAEEGIVNGMQAIVEAGDRNAIQIGQTLGKRWNQLLWTTALQTMQDGLLEMQEQFAELNTSAFLALPSEIEHLGLPEQKD